MKVYAIAAAALLVTALTPSCVSRVDYAVCAPPPGVPQEVYSATVTSAVPVTLATSYRNRDIGAGLGAAVGFASGQLLGGGSGRVAAAVGMTAAGAIAGHCIADAAGRVQGQRLTVRLDRSRKTYSIIQPVFRQFGPIPVGCHGTYHHGFNAHFTPDGY